VEKSPENLRHIEAIETHVPGAAFIHIVRNGADVVASLHAAANAGWKGFERPMTLDECIQRWTTDLEITRRELGKPNHFLVRYETLVSDPSGALKRVCAFLGLAFDEGMLERRREAARQIILPWEHWKAGVFEPIRNANATKFYDSLGPDEREYVLAKTSGVEIPFEM
jgi:hypothetical protein